MRKTELSKIMEDIKRIQERRPFPGYIMQTDFENPIFVNENVWTESSEMNVRKDTLECSVGKSLKGRESDGERMCKLQSSSRGNVTSVLRRREIYRPLTSSNQIVMRSKDTFLEDKVAKLRSFLRENREIVEKLDGKPAYLWTQEQNLPKCEMVSLKALENGSTYDREPSCGILKMKPNPDDAVRNLPRGVYTGKKFRKQRHSERRPQDPGEAGKSTSGIIRLT